MRTVLVALTAVLIGAAPVRAQLGMGVRAGDRVRIASSIHDGIFIVVRTGPDTLVLRGEGDQARVRLPLKDIDDLAVDRGRRSGGAGALRGGKYGLLIGGAAGAFAGLVGGDDECDTGEWCFFQFTAGEKAVLGAAAFGVVGGVLGLAIGASSPGTKWERLAVSHELRVIPGMGGGVGVTARLRF